MPAVASRNRVKLSLHDVKDVEALAGRVLEERLREWRATLTPERREDALAFLVATAWEISGLDSRGRRRRTRLAGAYDPARGGSFSRYCYRTLRLRLVDWFRATFGDARNAAPRPEVLSLDGPAPGWLTRPGGGGGTGSAELAEVIAGEQAGTEEEAIARAPLGVDWAGLSTPALWTVENVAQPLAEGDSLEAIMRRLGLSRRRINSRLEELRLELLGLHPQLPEVLR